ncbi:leucyl aminopeptidase [Chloroflexota bacterium]
MSAGSLDIQINVEHGPIQEIEADTIILNLFEGVKEPGGATGAVDKDLDGAITELIANGDFSGKASETVVVYPRGAITARRVILVGLGKRDEFDLETVRKAAAFAIKRARDQNGENVATIVHGGSVSGINIADAAQATVEGSILALYHYRAKIQKDEPDQKIQSLNIVEFDDNKLPEIESGVDTAKAVTSGVYLARDLVNLPPNIATPTKMASVAGEIAEENGMKLTVGGREWAAERQMGAFLAVAKGAGETPKFIVLEHKSDHEDLDTLVLIGKGITFDTGGISIKPTAGMGNMKSDMAGAAAVLGTMLTVGMLDLPLHIIGIAPCTENMPDANAYRPADVITASNGKTIEIVSTDAEGRMILADGLVFAGGYGPQVVIDLATLTGSCVIALGKGIAAGLFSNENILRDRLVSSSKATHEKIWPMPLWDDYKKKIKSEVADMKNGGGRYGGVGASAIFLKEFTNYPWAHLDIAGMALTDKESDYIPSGGTGFGVRLLVDFLRNY